MAVSWDLHHKNSYHLRNYIKTLRIIWQFLSSALSLKITQHENNHPECVHGEIDEGQKSKRRGVGGYSSLARTIPSESN